MISDLSNQVIDLDGQKLRIYLNQETKIIEAIEILEKIPTSINPKGDIKLEDYNI